MDWLESDLAREMRGSADVEKSMYFTDSTEL